jgi:hypothetical protein
VLFPPASHESILVLSSFDGNDPVQGLTMVFEKRIRIEHTAFDVQAGQKVSRELM